MQMQVNMPMPLDRVSRDPGANGAPSSLYAGFIRCGDRAGAGEDLAWSAATTPGEVTAMLAAQPGFREMLERNGPHADPERFLAPLAASPSYGAPYVLLGRAGGRARAVVLGRSSTRRVSYRLGYARLRWLPMRCMDVAYRGLITDGSVAASRFVVEQFQALLRQREFDRITVNKLPLGHPLAAPLRVLDRSVVERPRAHWMIDLQPGDFESTMSRHSARHRSHLRRLDRRLTRRVDGELEVREYRREEEFASMLAEVRRVAAETYQTQIGAGIAHNPGLEQVLGVAARSGKLLSFALYGAGRPLAFQLGVVHGDTYYCEGTGYCASDEGHRPGTVLFIRVLQRLCELGLRRVDFGFGDSEYKRVYGTRYHFESTIHVYGPGLRTAVPRLIDSSVERIGRSALTAALEKHVRRQWRTHLSQVLRRGEHAR